jgi:long-chain acyl-CoA synthetase
VWPREIEEVLAMHPAVQEAGVAAVPDATRGERPKAWVVLRPDGQATPEELRAFCEAHLAKYKVPIAVAIVAELPKTPVGKVLRRKLRELPVDAPPNALPAAVSPPVATGAVQR